MSLVSEHLSLVVLHLQQIVQVLTILVIDLCNSTHNVSTNGKLLGRNTIVYHPPKSLIDLGISFSPYLLFIPNDCMECTMWVPPSKH